MRDALRAVWGNPYVRVLVGILVLVVLVLLLRQIRPAVVTFALALTLAYLANPMVAWLEAHRAHRAFGVVLVYTVAVAAVVGLGRLVGSVIRQAVRSGEEGPALAETVTAWVDNLPVALAGLLPPQLADLLEGPLVRFQSGVERALTTAVPRLDALGSGLYGAVSVTVSSAFQVVVVLILTAYALYDYPRFSAALLRVFPIPYQKPISELLGKVDDAMGAFIRGQLVVALSVGLLVWLGLSILRIPGASLIGLFAAILNIVPFLGSVVPALPALLLALGGGWPKVLGVLVVFVAVNQIDNHVLTPQVLGRSTELHPITVIVAVIAGFAALGFVGAILAVPTAAFLRVMYLEYYQRSRFYREG